MLAWMFLSSMHMYLERSFGFFSVPIARAVTFPSYMGPIDYGQHFSYLFWTPLTRSLSSICCLGFIHEIFEVPYLHEPFNLIPKRHTPFGIVPYILMEGTIFLDVSSRPIALHSFGLSVWALIHYCVDIIHCGSERMIVCILQKGSLDLGRLILLFLRGFSRLFLSLSFFFALVAIKHFP